MHVHIMREIDSEITRYDVTYRAGFDVGEKSCKNLERRKSDFVVDIIQSGQKGNNVMYVMLILLFLYSCCCCCFPLLM